MTRSRPPPSLPTQGESAGFDLRWSQTKSAGQARLVKTPLSSGVVRLPVSQSVIFQIFSSREEKRVERRMDLNSPGSSHTQWLRKQFSGPDNRGSAEPWPDLLMDRSRLASGSSRTERKQRSVDVSAVERNNIVNIW